MASIKFVCTNSTKFKTLPFQAGQIIFVEDQRAIYVDGTVRTAYQDIVTLADESERLELEEPKQKFYFVEETKVLWEYDENWIQLTAPPETKIVFARREDFPVVGMPDVIYIDGTSMYRYLDGEYQLMNSSSGGGSIWVNI